MLIASHDEAYEAARALVRAGQLAAAHAAHHRLVAGGAAPSEDARVSLSHTALLVGDVAAAVSTIEDVAGASAGHPRAVMTRVLALTHAGRGEEARTRLKRLERLADDGEQAACLASIRALSAWIEERDDEALEAAGRARAALDGPPASYRAALASAAVGVVLARAGELDEADRRLARAEALLGERGDPLAQRDVALARALWRYERGDRLEALAALREAAQAFARCGHRLGELVAGAWIGRVLVVLGRREEGLRVLADVETRAFEHGLVAVARLADRGRRHDAAAQLDGAAARRVAETRRGERARLCALQAFAAATRGEAAPPPAPGGTPDEGPGYALDRAIHALARAARHAVDGDAARARDAVDRACAEATAAGVDAAVLRDLLGGAGALRVVTPRGRRLCREPGREAAAAAVLVDGGAHLMRAGGRIVSLERRPVVRQLFYALAARPGERVGRAALAQAAWGGAYDPRVHDNPLKANVAQLRKVLHRTGLSIDFDRDGYRLSVPAAFCFVEPCDAMRPASRS